jgi:hypothetical protein
VETPLRLSLNTQQSAEAERLISADSNTNRLAWLPYTLELISSIEKSW